MAQYHFDPSTYEALIAEEVPAYARLQEAVSTAAAGRPVRRFLDLGVGTGATALQVLEVYPDAQVVGIDESAEMLAAARKALPPRAELRVAQLQDPLPPGSFDLVVSALAVHHLDGPGKADLFRRIGDVLAESGRFVLGDVVVPEDPADVVTPIDGVHDTPDTAADQLAWLEAAGLTAVEAWSERDLAVLVADKRG